MTLEEKCSSLLGLIPVILDLIKQAEDVTADELIIGDEKHSDDINNIINELYGVYSKKGGETDILEIKYLCTQTIEDMSETPEKITSKAVSVILQNSSPSLVNSEVNKVLMNAFKESKDSVIRSPESCGGILGGILDNLPRVYFESLGYLCAYVRDYSEEKDSVCYFLSQCVFGKVPSGEETTAEMLMTVLVNNAEPIFGRIARVIQ